MENSPYTPHNPAQLWSIRKWRPNIPVSESKISYAIVNVADQEMVLAVGEFLQMF